MNVISMSLECPCENLTTFLFAKHPPDFAVVPGFPPSESVGLLTFVALATLAGKDTMQRCN